MNMGLGVHRQAQPETIDNVYNSLFVVLNSLRLFQTDTKSAFKFSWEIYEFQLGARFINCIFPTPERDSVHSKQKNLFCYEPLLTRAIAASAGQVARRKPPSWDRA